MTWKRECLTIQPRSRYLLVYSCYNLSNMEIGDIEKCRFKRPILEKLLEPHNRMPMNAIMFVGDLDIEIYLDSQTAFQEDFSTWISP